MAMKKTWTWLIEDNFFNRSADAVTSTMSKLNPYSMRKECSLDSSISNSIETIWNAILEKAMNMMIDNGWLNKIYI